MPHFTSEDAAAINILSRFLAHEQVRSLSHHDPVDVIVLVGNAILPTAELVFSALEARPDLARVLAVASHPLYRSIVNDVEGQPEAVVIHRVLEKNYATASMTQAGLQILIEDKSTNCGANAFETRKLLDEHNVRSPASMIIVQDPTMSLRTLASFKKVYQDHHSPPKFLACPSFVPEAVLEGSELALAVPGIDSKRLWTIPRLLDLIMGEIPRLRDDEQGYGPKGKGFIAHVDIPEEVEAAWSRLSRVVEMKR